MILESAKAYFASNPSIRVGHLIAIELAGSNGVFEYLTDYYRNISFAGNTYVAGKVKSISALRQTQGVQNYSIQINIAGEFQEEANKVVTSDSYEGREIVVLKAYLDASDNIIPVESSNNGPQIYFKGKIFGISINENITSGSSIITWECSGVLRDFEKVNGRVTDDDFHRGIVTDELSGLPIPSDGAKKPAYKTDTGFLHTNQTITSNIKYIGKEKQYYLKKSWGGLKNKLREREVEVERKVELNTSLAAKYLPVVFGVRKVPGIPVFLDVDKNNPQTVYCVYAVCEGEIEAFLDVYINGSGAICSGTAVGTEGSCMGDKTKGHTLGMYMNSAPSTPGSNDYGNDYRYNRWKKYSYDGTPYAIDYNAGPPSGVLSNNSLNTLGTSHGLTINVAAEGGAIQLTFYHGKSDQLPDSQLVTLAASNRFLVQSSTKAPDGSSWGGKYWANKSTGVSGAALLDTAYVVAKFDFSDTRTELPNLEFIVSGKLPRVYTSSTDFTESYTLNPVWHVLEYITNPYYGGGIPYEDIDIPSFIATANKLNTVDTSYETSYVKHWRYVGWKSNTYSRAMVQSNCVINTEDSVTKNVEELLQQFAGTLNIIGGKYSISVEDNSDSVAAIDIGEVIGRITVRDKANKDRWNSVQTSIVDPSTDWSTSQINFFNSTYLTEDNGIQKKGSAVFYNTTNYYTARSWAKRVLDRSRDGKTYSFTTYFKYMYLSPNDNITLNYPRLGLNNSKVRVTEVSTTPDGLVSLVVESFNPAAFTFGSQSEQAPGVVTVPPIPIPQDLTFNLLPNPSIPVVVQDPEVYGILTWQEVTDALRYEVKLNDIFLGSVIPSDTVNVSGVGQRNYMLIRALTVNTSYTFKVLAISKTGAKSAYAVLDYTSPASITPAFIPPVTGLVSNSNAEGVFSGPDLTLSWDTQGVIDAVTSFQLQILDINGTLLHQENINKNIGSFVFTLSLNKQAYSTQTGTVGAFRGLKPRIRSVADSSYSAWSDFT